MLKNLTDEISKNKNLVIFGGFVVLEIILYQLFSQPIIASMYREESLDFLNNILEGRDENTLDFYYQRFNSFFISFNFLFVAFGLFISFCLRVRGTKETIFSSIKEEIISGKAALIRNRRILFFSWLLSLVFFGLYVVLGLELIPNFSGNFFGADHFEWLSLKWSRFHKGSHTNRLIFLELFSFIKTFSPMISLEILAILLNAFFGSLGVFLSSMVFWTLTRNYKTTVLLSLLFGLSMNHLFFSALPESRSLQACSIIPTYLLLVISLKSRRIYLGYWILAGLLSFGVAITNITQTVLCFAVIVWELKPNNKIVAILEYTGTIVALSFFLNVIQKTMLGGSYFFVPNTLTTELKYPYISISIISHPLLVIQELIKNFFLFNFVSPSPLFSANKNNIDRVSVSFFEQGLDYSIVGWITVILWLILLIYGVYKNITASKREQKALLIGVSLAIFSTLVFHSLFNVPEMFLYTTNYSFPILLLAISQSLIKAKWWTIALIAFIILMGFNNLAIMKQIISV